MAGNAPMPEPGFAQALYYPGVGQRRRRPQGRRLGARHRRHGSAPAGPGLRLVPGPAERGAAARPRGAHCQSASRIRPPTRASPPCGPACWPRWRSSTMCRRFRKASWSASCGSGGNGKMVPALRRGRSVVPRDDAYAAAGNCCTPSATIPIWTCGKRAASFFKDFPIEHLMSYYPAAFPGAGERLPHRRRSAQHGEPDLQAGRAFPRGRTGHGGLRPERAGNARCCRAG